MSGLRLTEGSRGLAASVAVEGAPLTRTQVPYVTGSSVLGMKCADGVVIACDTMASYGTLARFKSLSRMHQVSPNCILGVGGDYSDFQQLQTMVDAEMTAQYVANDGLTLSPKAIHSFLARHMYHRRCKVDPLWNTVIVAGFDKGEGVLSLVDLFGTAFSSDVLATGFGLHLGLPLLRNAHRPDITVAEAKGVLEDILKVLFYRDARTNDVVQLASVTAAGVEIGKMTKLKTEWGYKSFVEGARVGDDSSW
ncbi:hypothetical protein BU14_2149s0001 [Porphyra umbilicalis]|uniref:Proteasome subunit beta n=1 Tax=Porphyra umbilicalis TaxID=2786 RepID=A0A1X6NJT9_PORUM|nr:hypothetical protein BU14_2149s0001 [Porphyra umbilicalis]|eukprot:OSX68868.1 hypothetical protein BU14_2149s0001 [Porphyra umbilicalis]